jgi:hypothetical protein
MALSIDGHGTGMFLFRLNLISILIYKNNEFGIKKFDWVQIFSLGSPLFATKLAENSRKRPSTKAPGD